MAGGLPQSVFLLQAAIMKRHIKVTDPALSMVMSAPASDGS